jgi:hypothetical protein
MKRPTTFKVVGIGLNGRRSKAVCPAPEFSLLCDLNERIEISWQVQVGVVGMMRVRIDDMRETEREKEDLSTT